MEVEKPFNAVYPHQYYTMELMVDYSKSFLGTWYKWGGDDPSGMDCSGFVQEVLASVGVDPVGDQTAQALYDAFIKRRYTSELGFGSILFFGKDLYNISHVAICIDKYGEIMIEAAGGGSSTHTAEDAIRQNAFIRQRPIKSRSDFLTAVKVTIEGL